MNFEKTEKPLPDCSSEPAPPIEGSSISSTEPQTYGSGRVAPDLMDSALVILQSVTPFCWITSADKKITPKGELTHEILITVPFEDSSLDLKVVMGAAVPVYDKQGQHYVLYGATFEGRVNGEQLSEPQAEHIYELLTKIAEARHKEIETSVTELLSDFEALSILEWKKNGPQVFVAYDGRTTLTLSKKHSGGLLPRYELQASYPQIDRNPRYGFEFDDTNQNTTQRLVQDLYRFVDESCGGFTWKWLLTK